MQIDGSIKIAGSRTVDDWAACKAALVVAGDAEAWIDAHESFFVERLRTRYFGPVEALQRPKLLRGEGFSIVAIQCSLIEFLGSAVEGKSYRYRQNKKTKLGTFEYDDSKNLFVRFLTTASPFKNEFDVALAKDFYASVRCGLLHEARTKNGWVIRATHASRAIVDFNTPPIKIVYRDNLQRAFDGFVDWYRTELPKDRPLQEAFIRKFDSLCQD